MKSNQDNLHITKCDIIVPLSPYVYQSQGALAIVDLVPLHSNKSTVKLRGDISIKMMETPLHIHKTFLRIIKCLYIAKMY